MSKSVAEILRKPKSTDKKSDKDDDKDDKKVVDKKPGKSAMLSFIADRKKC